MTTTAVQLQANQRNAEKSTGPKTEIGKSRSSQNALVHGIFSRHLFLADEDPQIFADLLSDLTQELRPSGVFEMSLTERIAVTLWRQLRLLRAETASLELERKDLKVAHEVSRQLDLGYKSLKEDDLNPIDPAHLEWCQSILDEYHKVDSFDLDHLEEEAPLIYKQLKSEAEEDQETIEKYLSDCENGLNEYLSYLMQWCRAELAKARKQPGVLAVAELVRSEQVVLSEPKLNLFMRYQTTLDNQLMKLAKALREAQDWRVKNLELETNEVD